MRNLFLALQGYKQIDEVIADWELVQYTVQGEVISSLEYSIYHIFYNSKKDTYKLLASGFKPYQNVLHAELSSIVNFLNKKPVHEKLSFWNNSQDYFIQKSKLDEMIKKGFDMEITAPAQEFPNLETINKVRIVKLELNNYKEHLSNITQNDPRLIKTMQEFKKNVLQKKDKLDIWQDLGNVVITSEGCYFAVFNKNIKWELDEGNEQE